VAAGAHLLEEVEDVSALEDVRAVGGDEDVEGDVRTLELGEDVTTGNPGFRRRLDALEEASADPAFDAIEADAGEGRDALYGRRICHWYSNISWGP
jgi:hypothetical protein